MMVRRFFGIISALLLCCSCAVDPEAPTDTPYITSLSTEEVGTNTATIAGSLAGKSQSGLKYILHIRLDGSSDDLSSYTATPDASGRISWKVDGLTAVTSYCAYAEIDSGHGTIESQRITFTTDHEYVYFESEWLRKYIINLYDIDHNGKLSYEEAALIQTLVLTDKPVMSLVGVEKMISLKKLSVEYCKVSGEVDLSNCQRIEYVSLKGNPITELTLGELPFLNYLCLFNTYLRDINFDGVPGITYMDIQAVPLNNEVLDREMPKLPELKTLLITENPYLYETLDLSHQHRLADFTGCRCHLRILDFTHCADTMFCHCCTPQIYEEEIDTIFVRKGQVVYSVNVDRDVYNMIAPRTVVVEK